MGGAAKFEKFTNHAFFPVIFLRSSPPEHIKAVNSREFYPMNFLTFVGEFDRQRTYFSRHSILPSYDAETIPKLNSNF